ncbi:MAG: hypothetical protein ACP5XB_18215 [Isosphaeraceae bacterium]
MREGNKDNSQRRAAVPPTLALGPAAFGTEAATAASQTLWNMALEITR